MFNYAKVLLPAIAFMSLSMAAMSDPQAIITKGTENEIIELLEKGYDSSSIIDYNSCKIPLLLMAAMRNQVNVIDYLCTHGTNVYTAISSGRGQGLAAIHIAALMGYVGIIDKLQKHGVDLGSPITAGSAQGKAPIHIAACKGHVEVIDYLHTHGVDLDTPVTAGPDQGKTALDIVMLHNQDYVIEYLRSKRVTVVDEDYDSDSESESDYQYRPLPPHGGFLHKHREADTLHCSGESILHLKYSIKNNAHIYAKPMQVVEGSTLLLLLIWPANLWTQLTLKELPRKQELSERLSVRCQEPKKRDLPSKEKVSLLPAKNRCFETNFRNFLLITIASFTKHWVTLTMKALNSSHQKKNPQVSMSEILPPAEKYAAGLKFYGSEIEPLEPEYDETGKPKHPYLGKLFVALISEAKIQELDPYFVVWGHANSRIRINTGYRSDILIEREVAFPGLVPGDCVVLSVPVRVPSFAGEYQPWFQDKYGLSKKVFDNKRIIFQKADNGTQKSEEEKAAAVRSLLEGHIIPHLAKILQQHIATECAAHGIRLVYKQLNGDFGPTLPSVKGKESDVAIFRTLGVFSTTSRPRL